jgi:hypothetical protein
LCDEVGKNNKNLNFCAELTEKMLAKKLKILTRTLERL